VGKEPLDDDLVQKAAAGCESAFKALLVASYDNIYRMAWRWVGSRAEAEAGRRTCHKRPQRLCEIVVGEKGKVTGMVAGQQVVIRGLEPSSSTPEDEVIGQDLWREVRALPPQQRDAVLLVYGEDLSHAEAAEIMGCAESTVSGHLHTARKRLKQRLVAAG